MLETLRSFIEPPVSSEPDQGTAKIAWLIRLRWVAIGAQLLSILPALHFALLERWLLPSFLGVVAVLATWNVVTWLALRRGLMSRQRHVLIQLAADVTAPSASQ